MPPGDCRDISAPRDKNRLDQKRLLADVGLSGFGQTAVFVIDDEIGGSTVLLSTGVSLDCLMTIAEEMYR